MLATILAVSIHSPSTVDADEAPFTKEDLDELVGTNRAGEYQLDVLSIFYSAQDESVRRILEGLLVESAGRLGPVGEERAKGGKRNHLLLSVEHRRS